MGLFELAAFLTSTAVGYGWILHDRRLKSPDRRRKLCAKGKHVPGEVSWSNRGFQRRQCIYCKYTEVQDKYTGEWTNAVRMEK